MNSISKIVGVFDELVLEDELLEDELLEDELLEDELIGVGNIFKLFLKSLT